MNKGKNEELVTPEGKWSEGHKKHLREQEAKKRPKTIKGTFMGCRSSDDYDEIHIQTQDPIIEKLPIAMISAVAIFQKHKLEKGDKISFTLDKEGWADLLSLKILERLPRPTPFKRRLSYAQRRHSIIMATIYNETIGWYKKIFGRKSWKRPPRIRWFPVKKGPKGAIWIPLPVIGCRKYITPEKFEELKASGTIVIERPPDL